MLKKGIIRRITISSLALIILLITYFFPTKNESVIPQNLSYNEVKSEYLYVLNEFDYVSRINMVIHSEDTLDKIKEIINILTIKSKESEYLPPTFNGIIPINTKLNDLELKDGLLKLDFSREFLNTTKDNEKKLIESIIYSLTELDNVNDILIFIDGKQLLELPFSKEKLPPILNKDYGINKVYDLDSIKNTTKTTIYYNSKANDVSYYIPITYIDNNTDDKIKVIIEKLKTSPIYESNLVSYLRANAEVTNYQLLEEEIKLSFNKYLLNEITNDDVLEEVKYTIFLSLRDTLNVKKVEFNILSDNKNINFALE